MQGKQRPSLYLDEAVRKGISTFHLFAEKDELRIGLAQLGADIASGHIAEVIRHHLNDDGDDCFLSCENKH